MPGESRRAPESGRTANASTSASSSKDRTRQPDARARPKREDDEPPVDPSKNRPKQASSEKQSEVVEAERWDKVVSSGITSHAAFLAPLINTFATLLVIPPISSAILLGVLILACIVYLPPPYVPYLASLISFFVPLANTYKVLQPALYSSKGLPATGIQWIYYWVMYVLLEGLKGVVGVYRPGWRWWFEIWRLVWLVVVGGPWFAKDRLVAQPEVASSKPKEPATANSSQSSGERDARKRAEAKERAKRAQQRDR